MKSEHAARMLPVDHDKALLVGRMQLADGPTPVVVKGGKVIDVSAHAATVADLLERSDIASLDGPVVCDTAALADAAGEHPPILSPIDLQCVKAAGVTFAVSALERVIEERARGDADAAQGIRGDLEARIGGGIRSVKPGSSEAAELKAALIEAGMWSQYLEVAIGPDAEVFTKAPVLSTVGWGADVGIRSDSSWNNPEPEIVVVATSDGKVVGATLGNDVNLRDFEGRSALLLGKAKDNNASTGIGPFIRLFDGDFTMDTVRDAVVDLRIDGPEGYVLTGTSTMREISRDPEDLVRQALSEHQYPDGFVLFLGTLFAPVQDRDEPGRGFTHKPGDVVRISTPSLGELANTVTTSKAADPWGFGIRDLMRNLARRGLIAA
ncbi:fumarylacetoacetate hydrolase family protein [Sphingomonas lacusdianchii]|uniref:fumarylacetoacetate hydrolase family protein n=1 Tax=Sphingomonas lacusdianchii TaxID=2917992 RepID=UPI001F5884F6|nr:fumarylacetoacetate hydrolase family protein [Sphingomonas sp. JXJ CY 53]